MFSGHRFQPDRDGAVKRLLLEFIRQAQQRSLDIRDSKMKKRAFDFSQLFEQTPRLERALSLATAIRPLADNGDGWNADPLDFSTINGIVNLRIGTRRDGAQRTASRCRRQ